MEEEYEGEEKEEDSHAEKKKRKFDEDIAKLEKAREVLKAVLSVDSNSNQESEVNPMEMIAQGYAASESEEEDGEVDHEETKIEKKISREWKILEQALAEKVKQEKQEEEETDNSKCDKHSRRASDRNKSKENEPYSHDNKKHKSKSPIMIDLTDDSVDDRHISREKDYRNDSRYRESRRSSPPRRSQNQDVPRVRSPYREKREKSR